jgi:hypothetical protein
MSFTKEIVDAVRRANAEKSTGPRTANGKQISRMNAVKHNLSGQNLILLESERVAYNRMATSMLNDLNPKTEPERQIAQKIIDTNFRLNRLTAIESNMFSFGLLDNETDSGSDDQIETMAAQTRAWIERAHSFDLLGRYETRLSRQLLKYQQEFERLQTERKSRSAEESKQDPFDPASFGRLSPEFIAGPGSYRVMTPLLPPEPVESPIPDLPEPEILETAA